MLTSVKVERMKAGLKQWELAMELGMDPTRLSMIETGRLAPSEELKREISRVLKKPVGSLFPQGRTEHDTSSMRRRDAMNDEPNPKRKEQKHV